MKLPGVNQYKVFILPQKFKSEQQIDFINHIQNLPESWVTELANIFKEFSSQGNSIDWESALSEHLHDPQACDYFKIIYGRLTGQFDEQFGPITDTDKQSCIYLLEQGFDACTPGVKERAQMYISILQKPIQLDELLCEYRTAIVRTALHHSRFSQNIHYHATILSRAKQQFGINYQLDSTPYATLPNSEVDKQLRNIIEPNYQMHHLVDGIIQVIEDSIFRVDPHLNYDNGDSCHPVYSNEIHGRYNDYLNAIIDNNGRYETLAYEVDEYGLPKAMKGINWTDIRKRLWELLQHEDYIDNPKPDYTKLANNNPDELTKASYYFLALAKNDPEQLPQYCLQLDHYQCLKEVAHQAFGYVIDTESDNLPTLINNIKLSIANNKQTHVQITEIFDETNILANVKVKYVPKLLKAYYKFLGENDLKEWLMADDCQKLRQLLSNDPQHTHQALYECFDAQTIATLLTRLQRAMSIEYVRNDNTIWHMAAQHYDARVIDELLQKTSEIDISPNVIDSTGESASSIALKTHNTENARLLIEQGAPLSTSEHSTADMLDLALKLSSDLAMETILPRITHNDYKKLFTKQYAHQHLFLVYAIQHGKTDVFDNILQDSSVLNAIDWTFIHEGKTLAQEAVKSEHDQAYDIVLKLDKISKNRRLTNLKMSIFKYLNLYDQSPLHMLARNHSAQAPSILQAFLDGTIANTQFELHQKDLRGNTLVDYAIYQDNTRIMDCILNHGPDSKLNYQSLLYQAIQYDKAGIIDVLIDHGAQVNEPIPTNNFLPLSQAISGNKKDATDKLIERGADVSVQNPRDDTMLNFAIRLGHPEIAKRLLNARNIASIINEPTDYGKTPLHTAIQCQYIELVIELINHSEIDLNRQDNAGYTALHFAALMDDTAIVEQLLDCDTIEINKTTNRFGETAAFQACREGLPSIVECFKNRAPQALHYTDHNGLTALHYCCLPPHIFPDEQTQKNTIIDTLILHGLDINAQENLGRTPLDIAKLFEGEHQLIDNLKQHKNQQQTRTKTQQNLANGAAHSSNHATLFSQEHSHTDLSGTCQNLMP